MNDLVAKSIQLYKDMMYANLTLKDADKMLSYFSKNMISIGTNPYQGCRSYDEFAMKVRNEIENDDIIFHMNVVRAEGIVQNDIVIITVYSDIQQYDTNEVEGRRASVVLHEENGELKIMCLHSSAFFDTYENIKNRRPSDKTPVQIRSEILKQKLELLNEAAPVGMIGAYFENQYPFYFVTNKVLEYLGYQSEKELREHINGNVINLIHPDERSSMYEKVKEMLEKNTEYEVDYRAIRKDGKYIWINERGRKTLSEDGRDVIIGVMTDMTKIREEADELRVNEERYKIALSISHQGMWEYDFTTKKIKQYNHSLDKFGFSEFVENVPESMISSGIIHPNWISDYNKMYEEMREGNEAVQFIGMVRLANGDYIWNRISYHTILNSDSKPLRAIGICEDISDEKETEIKYLREIKYRQVIAGDLILSYVVNLSTHTVEDYYAAKDFPLQNPDPSSSKRLLAANIEKIYNENDRKRFSETFNYENIMKSYALGEQSHSLDCRYVSDGGKIIWVNTSLNVVREPNAGELLLFVYVRNIDERKKSELALIERADRDPMTKLYNRATFESLADESLNNLNKIGNRCAMMMIDIDNFKNINDRYGHQYGDKVLSEIGNIIFRETNNKVLSGRIGGDEFLLLCENVKTDSEIFDIAKRLCVSIEVPYRYNGGLIKTSASIGIAFGKYGSTTFEELYNNADNALYEVKNSGKNGYSVFQGEKSISKRATQYDCSIQKNTQGKCVIDLLDCAVVVIAAENYEMLYMNSCAIREFEMDDSSYIGKKCYEIIENFKMPCPFCMESKHCRDGLIKDYVNTKNFIRYITQTSIINWNHKKALLKIMIPYHNELSTNSNDKIVLEGIILECIGPLVSAGNLDVALNYVLRNIGEFYDADRAYIIEMDNNLRLGCNTFEWCNEDVESQKKYLQEIPFASMSRWIESFQNHAPIIINDIEDIQFIHNDEYVKLKAQGIKTLYAVAFNISDVPIGYIGVDNPKSSIGDISLLNSLAYFIVNEMQKRKIQKMQEYLSYHDELTGLLGRNSYSRYMNTVNEETLTSMGVLCADINGLKRINQRYNHQCGDDIIKFLASSIAEIFGEESAYRLAGDEFLVLSQDITYEAFVNHVQIFRKRMENKYPQLISLGYTWTDTDIHIENLINHATELMLINKRKYYGASGTSSKNHSPKAERELRELISSGHFHMYLQAKNDITSEKLVGCEALVRYIDEQHGVVTPVNFISKCERAGLISYIDLFIFEEVCKTLERWGKSNVFIPISLNFSRATLFEINLIERILDIRSHYNIQPGLIQIEITESIGDIERTTLSYMCEEVRKSGFKLSLDDFGAMYSSLSVLSVITLDELKLDKSIVNEITSNNKSRMVVEHILALCRELQIKCVAEGVETREQLDLLRSLACDYAQGYYYCKPISCVDFEKKYID